MIKTKKTRYHRGSKIDEIVGMQYFENKPEVAFFKCLTDGYYSYVRPESLVETKKGEINKELQEICDHRLRTPVSEKGYNMIACTVCGKSWKEGELCEWKKGREK